MSVSGTLWQNSSQDQVPSRSCKNVLLFGINVHVDILWLCFARDNYGFVTFGHYDGACAAVERKFCRSYFNYVIGVLHATKVMERLLHWFVCMSVCLSVCYSVPYRPLSLKHHSSQLWWRNYNRPFHWTRWHNYPDDLWCPKTLFECWLCGKQHKLHKLLLLTRNCSLTVKFCDMIIA